MNEVNVFSYENTIMNSFEIYSKQYLRKTVCAKLILS